MAKPTVILDCVADRHSAGDERIVEVSSGFGGCLIALTERDGRLIVDVYRTDPTVTVRTDRDTGARKCCDCGRDLTDAMGVYVFTRDADGHTRRVPGLLRCVDCHTWTPKVPYTDLTEVDCPHSEAES